jgi:hypothetical protein
VKNPSAIYVLDGARLATALAGPDPSPKAIALADVLAMMIPSGVDPEALVFNPVYGQVYAANEESDTVTIARAVTRTDAGYAGGEVLNPGADRVFTDVCRGENGVVYSIDDYGEADRLAVGADGAVYLTDDRHRIAKIVDTTVVGTEIGGKKILHVEKMESLCRRMHVNIGIIAVPSEEAQAVCDLMVAAGILAIWNFAPVKLNVPEHILVQNEDMASSLAALSKHLKKKLNKS